jgi:acylphosphatase
VTDDVQRERIIFRGRVQGVGFRMRSSRIAIARRLAGWVCNESDGSVACVLEGTKEARDAFIEALSEAMAEHIDQIDRSEEPSGEPLMGFSIKLHDNSRR